MRALIIAVMGVAGMVILLWLAVIPDEHLIKSSVTFVAIALSLIATFFAGRELKTGATILAGPAVLTACAWAAIWSLWLAHRAGWQDLVWDPPDDGMDGTAAAIAFGLLFSTFAAVLVGPIVGWVSQAGKRPASRTLVSR